MIVTVDGTKMTFEEKATWGEIARSVQDRYEHTIVLAVAAAVFGAFLILKFRPYVLSRFQGWRHVWEYVNESQGYQQVRVLSYGASGGLFGMGIGNGKLGGGRSGGGGSRGGGVGRGR